MTMKAFSVVETGVVTTGIQWVIEQTRKTEIPNNVRLNPIV